MSAFSQLASTMRPSTPAVLRPALISVTRRTLTRALLRERSISFCKLRTLERSPACDAAKIRRLSRRTCSSAWPQSTVSQSRPSSSGSFTRSVSNLSLGSGVLTILSPQAHQTRVSALSSRAAALSGQLCGNRWRRSQHPVPFSCCLSATGIRFPGLPAPAGGFGFPHGRPTGGHQPPDPSGLSRSACDRYDRGGRPLNPGDSGALPASQIPPAGTRRLPTVGPCSPACCDPPAGVLMTRRHRGFTHVHPSGLPQPVAPGWNRSPWAFPRASHPAVTCNARRGGDGPCALGRVLRR